MDSLDFYGLLVNGSPIRSLNAGGQGTRTVSATIAPPPVIVGDDPTAFLQIPEVNAVEVDEPPPEKIETWRDRPALL